jgi:2-haloacid dehalogenase
LVDSQPAVVVFDVFGTVVDWRGSVMAAGANLAGHLERSIDWGMFAAEWRREGYLRPIMEVFTGQREWVPVDRLLEDCLGVLLRRYRLGHLAEADRLQLLSVWRRLTPWPDAVAGLTRLKARYLIGPLSNGGFALLTEMAKAGGLPWDFVISTELFRAYKPASEVYTGAARLLQRSPEEVMLVAAHASDLDAARANGMRTAYVPRPREWGPVSRSEPDMVTDRFDIVARDFLDLSDQLGA